MIDIEQTAIKRLRFAAEMSEAHYRAPLIITTSGGKDSDVCLSLARASGIRYEVMHNHTSVDAPETFYHVRKMFRELELDGIKCTINWPSYQGNSVNMWSLIVRKMIPPTRVMRYCCSVLKENGGNGRMITTGVRWEESDSRKKKRGIYESVPSNVKNKIILCNDNDDKRLLFESCRLKSKRCCNPIIDWTSEDVWDYIYAERIQTNPLYQCGFKRVGCIGCPLAGRRIRQIELGRYPTYKHAYIRTFDYMLAARRAHGKLDGSWRIGTTGRDVFHWWMNDGVLPGQLELDGVA